MTPTDTSTRYKLYGSEGTSGLVNGIFLGADSDFDRLVADAVRLVLTRRFSKLLIQDQGWTIFRVYRTEDGDVWYSRPVQKDILRSEERPSVALHQETLPGVDWNRV